MNALNAIRWTALLLSMAGAAPITLAQDRDARMADLDRKLVEARDRAVELQTTIEALSAELRALRQPLPPAPASAPTSPEPPADSFRTQMLRPDLGAHERDSSVSARPELFIQNRYHAIPIDGTNARTAPSNFNLTRMESRWSGRISSRVGIGFEIQYHPAPTGGAVELVNDAFVEYYPGELITFRVGQFVKPFGFDIQQSSSKREAPERGIFAGYFFPGQRDRGVMLAARLDRFGAGWHGAQFFAAAFNGNRFFTDRNRQLNYNLRFRKVFDRLPLALGVSAQLGRQLLPEDTTGNNRENVFGFDAQWAWRRLGVRAEVVGGNMPSTLLSLEPEFSPRFRPGAHSAGGALLTSFRLTGDSQIYARYDQFNGDPVSGQNVRAFDVGYFHWIGENSRIGVNYQFKNRPSFNDDLLNTRLQIIWNVVY